MDNYDLSKTLMHIYNSQMYKDVPSAVFKCLKTYIQILSKISEDPSNEKWQSIRKKSTIISNSIGQVSGGYDLLFKIGFTVKVKDFEEFITFSGKTDDINVALAWAKEKIVAIREKAQKEALAASQSKNQEAVYLENLLKTVDMERKDRFAKQQ